MMDAGSVQADHLKSACRGQPTVIAKKKSFPDVQLFYSGI